MSTCPTCNDNGYFYAWTRGSHEPDSVPTLCNCPARDNPRAQELTNGGKGFGVLWPAPISDWGAE